MTGTRRKEQGEARTSSASEPQGPTVVSRVAEGTDPQATVAGPVTEARGKERREARKKSPKREKKTKRNGKQNGKAERGKATKRKPEENRAKNKAGGAQKAKPKEHKGFASWDHRLLCRVASRRRDALSLTVSVWSFYVMSTTDNCQESKIGN